MLKSAYFSSVYQVIKYEEKVTEVKLDCQY